MAVQKQTEGQGQDARTAGSAAESDVADERAEVAQAETDGLIEFDERRAKLERLRAEGIDPYPPVSIHDRDAIADVLAAHDATSLGAGEHPELRHHVAGRLISRRVHGKTAFLDVRDLSGTIQLVVRVDALGETPTTACSRSTSATSSASSRACTSPSAGSSRSPCSSARC